MDGDLILTGFDSPLGTELVCSGGIIEDIGRRVSRPTGHETVDLGGAQLFPGFVDGHVHMRDPGHPHKEDFASGTAAAAAGGVTCVMCMPNTNPPVDGPEGFAAARAAGESGAVVDFTLQAAITRDNFGALAGLWDAGVTSFETLMSDAPERDRLDDPLVADSLAVFLSRRHYEVSVETDSHRALKVLRESHLANPDLIQFIRIFGKLERLALKIEPGLRI